MAMFINWWWKMPVFLPIFLGVIWYNSATDGNIDFYFKFEEKMLFDF